MNIMIIPLIFVSSFVQPDTLTLEQARRLALESFPLEQQVRHHRDIETLNIRNINGSWLPSLNVNAMAQYQSDVTKISFDTPLPGGGADLPSQAHDRYQVSLDIEQRLYDGGITHARREVERSRAESEIGRVRVSQHRLLERVDEAYFAVLMSRAGRESLELTIEVLDERIRLMQSQVEHGSAPASSLDILRAERIGLQQAVEAAGARIRSTMAVLAGLSGIPADENLHLTLPEHDSGRASTDFTARPEMTVLETERNHLEMQKSLIKANYRPKISAFSQVAYGRPGLNIFEEDFQPWYIVGMRATWPIWNWHSDRRKRQVSSVRQRLIDTEEDIFLRNMDLAVQKDLQEIGRLRNALEMDREIIELRERILAEASSRLDNGVITATEYITELNAKRQAELNLELHRIELARAHRNVELLTGRQ
jgi:outer membrane protein TolC